jgi:hypothetical protein
LQHLALAGRQQLVAHLCVVFLGLPHVLVNRVALRDGRAEVGVAPVNRLDAQQQLFDIGTLDDRPPCSR